MTGLVIVAVALFGIVAIGSTLALISDSLERWWKQ